MLRRQFGISAHEYLHVVPAWEVDVLLGGLRQESEPTGPARIPKGVVDPTEGVL